MWSKSVFLVFFMLLVSMSLFSGKEEWWVSWDIFILDSYPFGGYLVFDKISLLFSFTVSLVSFFVFIYSLTYMKEDFFNKKFIITLSSFVVSMFLLIFSADLFWVMLGWDGLGLSSMFLIFFFSNSKSFNSGMVTFLCNRMGDFFLISSLSILFFSTNYNLVSYWAAPLILMGGFSKSAQIPFSSWLPLAMAAPTPVSALVHSSTLVTAGVYLLIRFFNFLGEWVTWMCLISAITFSLGGSSGLGEFDLKKVIALSTLSHIGLMMFFISFSLIEGTCLHMVLHAFFKSLLFMIAGCIIHANGGEQDIRLVSVTNLSPLLNISLASSCISMMGIPFFSGFYSKEMFFNFMSESQSSLSFTLFLMSVFLTCAYTMRLLFALFSQSGKPIIQSDKSYWMIFFTLAVFSLSSGYIFWLLSPQGKEVMSIYPKFFLLASIFWGGVLGYKILSLKLLQSSPFALLQSMWGLSKGIHIFQKIFPKSWESLFKLDSKGFVDFVPLSTYTLGGMCSDTIYFLTVSTGFLMISFSVILIFSLI